MRACSDDSIDESLILQLFVSIDGKKEKERERVPVDFNHSVSLNRTVSDPISHVSKQQLHNYMFAHFHTCIYLEILLLAK